MNNRKILAWGSGTTHVATSVNGDGHEVDLENIYYIPNIHVQLLSFRKLVGHGWEVCLEEGGMELQDWCRDLFAVVSKVNNIYLMELTIIAPGSGLAVWMDSRRQRKSTHQEIVDCLDGFTIVTTARGGKGSEASLMTWHHQLSHLLFRTVMELVQRVSRMVTDVPAMIPSLGLCMICVARKSVYSLHKVGHSRASKSGVGACQHCRTYASGIGW